MQQVILRQLLFLALREEEACLFFQADRCRLWVVKSFQLGTHDSFIGLVNKSGEDWLALPAVGKVWPRWKRASSHRPCWIPSELHAGWLSAGQDEDNGIIKVNKTRQRQGGWKAPAEGSQVLFFFFFLFFLSRSSEGNRKCLLTKQKSVLHFKARVKSPHGNPSRRKSSNPQRSKSLPTVQVGAAMINKY